MLKLEKKEETMKSKEKEGKSKARRKKLKHESKATKAKERREKVNNERKSYLSIHEGELAAINFSTSHPMFTK